MYFDLLPELFVSICSGEFDPDSNCSGRFRAKRIKSGDEGRHEYAGVKGTDCSEGFTFIDSADLLDCPDSASIRPEDDIPTQTECDSTALPPISPPNPLPEIISESDAESELISSSSDESVPNSSARDFGANEIEKAVSKLEPGVAISVHTTSKLVHYRETSERHRLKCKYVFLLDRL